MTDTVQQPAPTPSWNAGLPPPRSTAASITQDDLVALITATDKVAGRDYLVIDVRRTDFEDYAIPNALNLPAHSLFPTRHAIVASLSHIPLLIFHCQSCGKPTSRGTTCASYIQDVLEETKRSGACRAVYLEGGIKGWAARFAGDDKMIVKL